MGIGNVLMGDEGVGVHLAQALEQEDLPEGIEVLDGGTGGFQLMEYFEYYPVVILIDATLDPEHEGAIRHIQPRFSNDFPKALSTHDIGLKDVVEGLNLLGRLPEVHLLTVSIRDIQPMKMELSDAIRSVFPELKDKVIQLAKTCLDKQPESV